MRILLVEDNASFAGDIDSALRDIPYCEIDWVKSQEEAIQRLGSEFYDIILLDREISPSPARGLEASVEHGWSLFLHIVSTTPGIPVRFLTGFWDTSLADAVMQYARPARACGAGSEIPMYTGVAKSEVHLLKREIEALADRISKINSIQVTIESRNTPTKWEEERVLRLYASIRGGASILATPFTDGLSGANVHKVSVLNPDQSVREVCVAKIGPSKEIQVEQVKHRDFFTQLGGGCVPNRTELIDAGAGSWAGAFYSVAGSNTMNLFEVISIDESRAGKIVQSIEVAQDHWRNGYQARHVSIRQLRQRYIGNFKLENVSDSITDLRVSDVEVLSILVGECVQHRDLHGGNVLVSDNDVFHFIDYAEAQPDCACSDAVMLELSIIFHKESANLRTAWPRPDNLKNWCDLELYLEGCPYPNFVRQCRAWALRCAGSENEVWAMAYAISLRQLQYADVAKENTIMIAESCIQNLLSSQS